MSARDILPVIEAVAASNAARQIADTPENVRALLDWADGMVERMGSGDWIGWTDVRERINEARLELTAMEDMTAAERQRIADQRIADRVFLEHNSRKVQERDDRAIEDEIRCGAPS